MTGAPTDVAVIGFGLRVPGASTAGEFWSNLMAGRESMTRFSAEELTAQGVTAHGLADPAYVPVRGVIAGIESFDAELFGFSPFEAALTDPQHRVFLECCLESLEHAGYAGETTSRIGILAGCGNNLYLPRHVENRADVVEHAGELAMQIAHEKDYLATRVAYRLGLTGPALTVQTACSTSLVAVHEAVRALAFDDADIMLAGGVSIELPQSVGYTYRAHDILSPDGHCRTFDAQARGVVPGNGAAVVVLKRLADAVRDRDTIYSVIRGSAINNDGERKAGFTAPSVDGQVAVIRAALGRAGVVPEQLQYVETHGTATEIGDAIELAALKEVFGGRSRSTACVLGTLKPNIGHLDTAAGVIALIKVSLALHHRTMPPSINYATPNADLARQDSPFEVITAARPWTEGDAGRLGGVSAFGIGGTNAHVLVGEAPRVEHVPSRRPSRAVIPVSAQTSAALSRAVRRLHDLGHRPHDLDLADVATTMQAGRRVLPYRSAAVVAGVGALADRGSFSPPVRRRSAPAVVLAFSGASERYAGVSAGLSERFPAFAEAMADCCRHLHRELGIDIAAIAESGVAPHPFPVSQSVTFAVEYATAVLLRSFGVRPAALIGHSLGEYAAASVSGALTLADASRLVVARARLMAEVPGGMLAVFAPLGTVAERLPAALSIAAVNSPRSTVVAGDPAWLRDFGDRLTADGIEHHPLRIRTPAHSALLDPCLEDFRAVAEQVEHQPLTLPMYSTVTGEYLPRGSTLGAGYWVRHLRRTVLFQTAAEEMLARHREPVVVEVGPGTALAGLVTALDHTGRAATAAALPGPGDGLDPTTALLQTVADLWCAGVAVRWDSPGLDPGGRRVALPTYPFERVRHWLDAVEAPAPADPVKPAESRPAPDQPAPSEPVIGRESVRDCVEDLWRELLGVAEIKAEDTFFGLGGQSLMAVRLIAAIRRRLGVAVPMRAVLSRPTVDGITDTVLAVQAGATEAAVR